MPDRRLSLALLLALALGALAAPGAASAAKVSETASGGALADAPAPAGGITFDGAPLTQSFQLKGKKVKKQQVKRIALTLNSSGSSGFANGDIRAKLIAPSGDNFGAPISLLFAGGVGGANLVNLKLDDRSDLTLCDPLQFQASDCNYVQASTPAGAGTATGTVGTSGLMDVFRGLNPKGSWRLIWWDTFSDGVTHTIGDATLEVVTGKKFAKEEKGGR